MTNKNPFPRPTLPDSQETQSDRATKQTNTFGEETKVGRFNQTAYDQYPVEGTILNNRYELLQKIGQGGMGQVYKALDIKAINIKSQPFYAIKILSPALIGNQREMLRLQTEAINAQELTHKNIIRVHHFDTDSKHIYLIMEWLDGKNFNDLLTPPNHHGIAFSVLKPYLPAIAEALDYAHREKNIIHRDIKPSNLFLTNDNRVVVIDFGVSYAINESQSRFSGTSGTPSYRPPEALVGGHQSGASDDVYALAVTLYELLTGDLPYHGTLISSRNADSPKPRKPNSLSQAQWQVLFNAFYFEPSKRSQSVGAFIAELCAVENSLESEQKAEAEAKRKAELAEAQRHQTELAKKQAEAERQRLQEVKKQALLAEKKRQEDAAKAKKLVEEKAKREADKTIDHYTVHNNGTVTDTKTGLTWQRCTYGQTWNGSGCSGEPKLVTWHEAMEIRDNFAGYSDWRLPTIDELGSLTYCSSGQPKGIYPGLIDYGYEGNYRRPTINTSVFPSTESSFYWSSSPNACDNDLARGVHFYYGGAFNHGKHYSCYVRLVRGGL